MYTIGNNVVFKDVLNNTMLDGTIRGYDYYTGLYKIERFNKVFYYVKEEYILEILE